MKKRISLKMQLMATMFVMVISILLLNIVVNNCFLEPYYERNKRSELMDGFETICEASLAGTLASDDFDVPFEKLCANGNINIIITSADQTTVVRTSLNDYRDYQMELFELMRSQAGEDMKVLDITDNYMLARLTDSRMDGDFLVLVGRLPAGEYIYMRTALESIAEVADLTNRFLLAVGMVVILFSSLMIVYLARRISRPIQEITDLSKRMSDLDFDAKYIEKKRDSREIDELGMHINHLSETLEKTISELKTANTELQQDIRKKEEIDTMRKEFLSNVSHELKTPIALISGYAEGLQECVNDDPESREFYCSVIMDEADKMNTMVKKLLTLNQLEFGNDVPDMKRFDMTELVKGVVQAQLLLGIQDDIDISLKQYDPEYVWGDPFKVEEVITNYMTNAIHHASGKKQIVISFAETDGLVRVSVFNTGDPIPEEELEKIWIKFYKVDKARTREYGGSGIGLSIVKAIMDSMGRKCGVINHEDGVEFWMELEKAGSKEKALPAHNNANQGE